ncbi:MULTISPECIES: helix-turn-helix domain-containing protein [Niastella]|uniref:Helix-turn-helix transcriptional regulator n=1 Tax=Niastella soli TaxID=2821487 RepID=A0ABS3Z431_9BACT|nr:AraC family transcriptional regulator [Niastella soli]MBO9204905.1 helix-turn-helix transcriptional regulator [Niastella soli]
MEYVDIHSISELHAFYRYEKPTHPLITIIDWAKVDRSQRKKGDIFYRLNMYSVSCKKFKGEFKYGRSTYDFSEGSLIFTAPHQALQPDPSFEVREGWALYIHPDFLNASKKGAALTGLSFFGYDTNEALHISDGEKNILEECLNNIQREIVQNMDSHTYNLMLTNLELFFGYCTRFYERQFLTRVKVSNDTLENFERLLNEYFAQDTLIETGLPDVKYFSSRLNLSSNYLSDLLSKYTGKSTQEHIHLKMIEKAKSLLWSSEMAISEIAYHLGFEHPSHFTKLFKSKTGKSPKEFRHPN